MVVALVGLCWLAFFNGLGDLGLMDKTEALFVEVGHQMLLTGDWVTPHWNGTTFFDYPVWGYWMVALSFKLFGPTAFAARLPGALAASLVVVATFGLLWRLAPAQLPEHQRLGRGLLGASVLATTPAWIGWARRCCSSTSKKPQLWRLHREFPARHTQTQVACHAWFAACAKLAATKFCP